MTATLPTYDETVERNAIDKLMTPGDLTLRNGDIATTRWGDLMLNDVDYSAYVRLVQVWRYNFPTIGTLFRATLDALGDQTQAESDLNMQGSKPWNPALGPMQGIDPVAFHEARDRVAAANVARGVYAGSVALFLSRILGTFREDISANKDEWVRAGTPLHGYSFGQVIEAAANNVRHADEWRVASSPTAQQLKSVNVLAAVLQKAIPANGSIREFAYDVSPDILNLLAGHDFLKLESAMFTFASALLALREKRAASG